MTLGEEAYAVSELDEQEIGVCSKCGKHYNGISCAEQQRIEKMAEGSGVEPAPLAE